MSGARSDARYLVEYASDAAFAIDRNHVIVAWNYAARHLLGYRRSEVLGRRCCEVLKAVYADGAALCGPDCEGARCFDHGRAFAARSCLARHKDGALIPLDLASFAMPQRDFRPDTRSALAVIMLRDEERTRRAAEGPRLEIFTLGRFALAVDGRALEVAKWKRKQALTLLKYLAAHPGRAVHREVLVEHLWPEIDERRGWERLKVMIYFLRAQLRAAGLSEDAIETIGKTYALRPEAVWLDSKAFEDQVAKAAAFERRRQWDDALHAYLEADRLYRGDYLGEDIYEDWCAEERERLREIHLEMRASLAECHGALRHWAEAAAVCRTILVEDPCREAVHRGLMEYLARLGHIDSAVAQYHHCERALAEELGVEPMPETHRLYRDIAAGKISGESVSAAK